MANRNVSRMNDRSTTPSALPSRTASPAQGTVSPRPSTEFRREETATQPQRTSSDSAQGRDRKLSGDQTEQTLQQQQPDGVTINAPDAELNEWRSRRPSLDSPRSSSVAHSLDLPRSPAAQVPSSSRTNGVLTSEGENTPSHYEKTLEQMRSDYEAAELRRQDETHLYLERIDALQSKLQYLTKEAAQIAKAAKSEAEFGSVEERLATKDEKIALLMEEGHKLSQTELKHMSIIKKLRAKSTDDDKYVAETKRLLAKHDKAAHEAQERAIRAEESEKRALEQAKGMPRLVEELETMRADRDAQDTLIQQLQTRLAEEKAQAEALELERKRVAELVNELSSTKTEKELAERQRQTELRELRDRSEREKERARVAEIERQGEQSILESRLEAYRARAEEASAGSGGDVQAKLLRQIETLQNQYAVASGNWQGIEGSLLARAAALERERDEIAKREADVRRKARETVSILTKTCSSVFGSGALTGYRT